jgi:hypothetical protein
MPYTFSGFFYTLWGPWCHDTGIQSILKSSKDSRIDQYLNTWNGCKPAMLFSESCFDDELLSSIHSQEQCWRKVVCCSTQIEVTISDRHDTSTTLCNVCVCAGWCFSLSWMQWSTIVERYCRDISLAWQSHSVVLCTDIVLHMATSQTTYDQALQRYNPNEYYALSLKRT